MMGTNLLVYPAEQPLGTAVSAPFPTVCPLAKGPKSWRHYVSGCIIGRNLPNS